MYNKYNVRTDQFILPVKCHSNRAIRHRVLSQVLNYKHLHKHTNWKHAISMFIIYLNNSWYIHAPFAYCYSMKLLTDQDMAVMRQMKWMYAHYINCKNKFQLSCNVRLCFEYHLLNLLNEDICRVKELISIQFIFSS